MYAVIILAKYGFSYKYIAKCTGLTYNQIHYILRTNRIGVYEYRHGKNKEGRSVTRMLLNKSKRKIA